MNPLLLILSIFDAFGAAVILWGPNIPILGSFMIYITYIILIKGILSVFTSFPFGFFDWMGVLDVIAGVVLLLISFGVNFQTFNIFAMIYAFKVAYCLFRTVLSI